MIATSGFLTALNAPNSAGGASPTRPSWFKGRGRKGVGEEEGRGGGKESRNTAPSIPAYAHGCD